MSRPAWHSVATVLMTLAIIAACVAIAGLLPLPDPPSYPPRTLADLRANLLVMLVIAVLLMPLTAIAIAIHAWWTGKRRRAGRRA